MPIYEYLCQDCGQGTEALQKIADAPLIQCPSCGQDALQKRMSAAGFLLKCGGWYYTDFNGSSGQKNLSEKPSDSSAKPADDKAKSS